MLRGSLLNHELGAKRPKFSQNQVHLKFNHKQILLFTSTLTDLSAIQIFVHNSKEKNEKRIFGIQNVFV